MQHCHAAPPCNTACLPTHLSVVAACQGLQHRHGMGLQVALLPLALLPLLLSQQLQALLPARLGLGTAAQALQMTRNPSADTS
jgi:hypothetical protein